MEKQVLFDRAMDYDDVTPAHMGAVYHQKSFNGEWYYFTPQGFPIDTETGDLLEIWDEEPLEEVEITTTVANGTGTFQEVTEKELKKPKPSPKVELKRWLMQLEGAETDFRKVRKYAKDVLGVSSNSKAEVVNMAIQNNIVEPGDVKVDL